ncbi:hypothetical protein Ciccas_013501 [Cichlidogyrus casuarinus]|uniref:Uncharacterized protein n=1 Tax=Cichlidogyrus casuarinus TaxID=1844966 RepID=A0ABD2PL77_9PLAT
MESALHTLAMLSTSRDDQVQQKRPKMQAKQVAKSLSSSTTVTMATKVMPTPNESQLLDSVRDSLGATNALTALSNAEKMTSNPVPQLLASVGLVAAATPQVLLPSNGHQLMLGRQSAAFKTPSGSIITGILLPPTVSSAMEPQLATSVIIQNNNPVPSVLATRSAKNSSRTFSLLASKQPFAASTNFQRILPKPTVLSTNEVPNGMLAMVLPSKMNLSASWNGRKNLVPVSQGLKNKASTLSTFQTMQRRKLVEAAEALLAKTDHLQSSSSRPAPGIRRSEAKKKDTTMKKEEGEIAP